MQTLTSTFIAVVTSLFLSIFGQFITHKPIIISNKSDGIIVKVATPSAKLQPKPADYPTIYSIPSPTPEDIIVTPTPTGLPWGTTEKLREHIYRTYVGQDASLGTAQEILTALNTYRKNHGRQPVTTDDRLCELAKARAQQQGEKADLDEHKGLIEYLNDPKHWEYLEVKAIGENASYGYQLSGTHLIEWIFDADEEHRDNQLGPKWNRACAATSGLLVEILFADK